jgi:HAE1 family hydrophobic/amphiphilic exporter-1
MIEMFIRRRVLTTVLVLIAAILGVLSYVGLGVRRFPEIEFPFVTVFTVYEGASPAEVESEITKRIEDAVVTISGIEEINSSSQQGLSLVFIEFGLEEDVDIKAVDVRNKIDRILPLLPEAADEPVPQKFEIGSLPVLDLALYGPQDPNELYRLADEELKPLLTQTAGVADVELSGGQEREIQVLLDLRKLRRHRVTIGMVVAAIRAANVDVPAGHITQPGREFVIRTPGRVRRPEEIEKIQVPTAGGGILTVGDLGTVVDTYEEPRTLSRYNGEPAIGLAVQARTDANEVEVVDGVNEALPRLRELLPEGAALTVARDTSVFIRGALSNVWHNMLIGVCLTAVVIYLFFRSPRSTLIVAVVMPAAVICAFIGMRAAGFTLNIISLTGLAIVIGVLVNNAILVLENVNRLVDEGMPPADAAVDGTRDIALAIFSSTATNLVVFLPIAFMGEIVGRFFRELGLTVVFATVASLLISFSLTPMMCGLLLRPKGPDRPENGFFSLSFDSTFGRLAGLWQGAFERAKGVYVGMLDWCLRHRLSTVFITFIFFVASFGVFAIVGVEFFPSSDEGRFRVSVEAPVGTPLEVTDRMVRRVEREVRDVPYLESYLVRVGRVAAGMSGRTEGVDLAEISVTIADRAERPEGLDEILNEVRPRLAKVPSAKLLVAKEEMGGPDEPAIGIEVTGDDLAAIKRVASQVYEIIQSVPGTAGVAKSWQAGQPEVHVIPDQEAANRQGVNVRLLAEEVRGYVEGTLASEFLAGDENYDVLVKLREEDRQWASDIERMFVSSATTGGMVPIGQVAEVRREAGSTLITRKDRTRLVTVTSGLTGQRPPSKVEADIRRRIEEEVSVPEGVGLDLGGEAEIRQQNFPELYKAMGTAAVLTFLCVAGIIESFGFAVIIIMSLPVSLIGVSFAMLVADVRVSMFALMAMVILVGMVVNNAIIVVDYAMRAEEGGKTAREAIRESCGVRYRMILMANLTTVAALIPLSLGKGFGGEIFRPLAVVQIGGVLAAALLSLLVIPAVYVMVRGRRQKRS